MLLARSGIVCPGLTCSIISECSEIGSLLSTRKNETERSSFFACRRSSKSARVRWPGLLRPLAGGSEIDKQSLLAVMSLGTDYRSREMMNLFLELIDDGTLDEERGFAMDRDLWSVLYRMSTAKPVYCSEAIGHWLDRQHELQARRSELSKYVISSSASGAPLAFARELLPRVARVAAGPDSAVWEHRPGLHIAGEIVEALSHSLRRLAAEDPGSLDGLVASLPAISPLLIDILKMDAWASNPDRYADQILRLLIEREELLEAPGSGRAIRAGSLLGSHDLLAEAERLILKRAPGHERGRSYGLSQYRLLAQFKAGALSAQGARRLEELRRKFGNVTPSDFPLVPQLMTSSVPPRVPDDATELMSDKEWLHAIRTIHRGRVSDSGDLDWDQVTLSRQLEARTQDEPERFASLAADLMTDDFPPRYFSAILDGLVGGDRENPPVERIVQVIRRLHELPGRPCGLAVVRAVKGIANEEVPPDVIEAVAFYAIEDPDPEDDNWFTSPPRDADPGELAHHAGINSVRGVAAEAIAALLFARADWIGPLRSAVEALVRDPTLTVRSIAALPLLAILRTDECGSLRLFNRLCADADPILGTPYFAKYLNHTLYRSYESVRPILLRMLVSQEANVRKAAAGLICLAALHYGESQDTAIEDVGRVEAGGSEMRTAAAEIYARYCGHSDVGEQCLEKLLRCFDDSAVEVRRSSARCFSHMEADQLLEHDALIKAFATSDAFAEEPSALLHRLESMSSPLPDSVCSLADRAIEAWGAAAGEISTSTSGSARILSKLIVRAYTQASDDAQRKQALDAIDRMIEVGFDGLQDELSAADRG